MTAIESTLPDWPRAYGEPPVAAVLRAAPADFFVEEVMGFEPDGRGEHCWLWVEKENLNTADAAQRLARFAGLRERDVSYSGLKDKIAVTRQWFCLHLLNRSPDWQRWDDPALRLLRIERHSRKLRRGTHRANRFVIVLRDLRGDIDALSARGDLLARNGVPNYFGEQRFGRGGRNLELALQMKGGARRPPRQQASMYLSAARSFVFNEVLAARIVQSNWLTPLPGDVFMLDGTSSVFAAEPDTEIRDRFAAGDIHITGPLCGRVGSIAAGGLVDVLEVGICADQQALVTVVEAGGVEASRRALRCMPTNLTMEFVDATACRIQFELPKGCFATSLVRELARYELPTPVPQDAQTLLESRADQAAATINSQE